MGKQILRVLKGTVDLYMNRTIPRSAAALSYYLTMSIFPLIICLYTLLGNSYAKMVTILNFADQFLSPETTRYIKRFLDYVAGNHNTALLAAGVTVLLTTSSAAVRSVQVTIGEMQGGRRYQGFRDFLFSLVFSVAFLAATYFAILVMLTGHEFLEFVDSFLPFLNVSRAWTWIRFLLLGAIEFVILVGVYKVSQQREHQYSTFAGALLSTLGVVAMSWIFSEFIAASARYPLVYGSLASLILLMFWLFLCCQIIYIGAALNVSIRDCRERGAPEGPSGQEDSPRP